MKNRLAPLKNLFLLVGVLTLTLLASSCRDDFATTPSTGNLEFSRDTIFLDTVFSNIGSSTYTLKVYNRSDKDISIPRVSLAKNENSLYRLNVDGVAGKEFIDVNILAKDSIFIFVETTVNFEDLPSGEKNNFLYTDALQFESIGTTQKVELVTLIQDAVFLFPKKDAQGIVETINLGTDDQGNELRIEGFVLDDDQLTLTNEKPYVIYGYLGVGTNKTLTIEAGARLHFHENSGIIVGADGRLEINGTLSADQELQENEVILEGDRLEPLFAEIPGQWGTVWLTPKSSASISHATIKNATIALIADTEYDGENTDVEIENTQIYNSSNIGLYCVNSSVNATNFVVNNSGLTSVWLRLGGSYNFTHSTIANYWNQGIRNFAALTIDNYLQTENETLAADLDQATFSNSIIYGNQQQELNITKVEGTAFNFNFNNSLLLFQNGSSQADEDSFYNFSNSTYYSNIVTNEEPAFKAPYDNDLRISNESAANALASPTIAAETPQDILGTARTSAPDSGAYESITFDEDN